MKLAAALCVIAFVATQAQDEPRRDEPRRLGPKEQAAAGRPGPWDNDVLVWRVGTDGKAERVTAFERAGVPTVARFSENKLIAAHQHFPPEFGADFDKVALRISEDDGKTWSAPKVMQLAGLPEGMRFPFDPTLVPLPVGRIRMYFTSRKLGERSLPAIYSAVSKDGTNYEFEPGMRFGIEGRMVIDCAVALHKNVFHLYSPDNGTGPGNPRTREGAAYHATSADGLEFKRVEDVQIEGKRSWLGNAQSDGNAITFYGTGMGIWTATSEDGAAWKLGPRIDVRGADPGAVKASDGSVIIIATGPPRAGTPSDRRRPQQRPEQ